MSIRHAILGFLSQGPQSGYDLKKAFVASELVPWSGNSNQIYTGLLDLERQGFVVKSVIHDDDRPSRKEYSLTPRGRAALKEWLLSEPELPELKSSFMLRLQWADLLTESELLSLLAGYEEQLRIKVLMLKEQAKRQAAASVSARKRQADLGRLVGRRWLAIFESEHKWVRELRTEVRSSPEARLARV